MWIWSDWLKPLGLVTAISRFWNNCNIYYLYIQFCYKCTLAVNIANNEILFRSDIITGWKQNTDKNSKAEPHLFIQRMLGKLVNSAHFPIWPRSYHVSGCARRTCSYCSTILASAKLRISLQRPWLCSQVHHFCRYFMKNPRLIKF